MKKSYYLLLIILSFIISTYLIFEIKRLNGNLGYNQNQIERLKLNTELLENHLREKIKLEQFDFNPSVELFGNNDAASSLLDVSEGNLKLVIFYPKEVCNVCFGNQLDIIDEFVREIDMNDFIVVSEAENFRKVMKELKDKNFQNEVFFVNKSEFLDVNNCLSPIIFILNENMVGIDFFPLIKGNDKLLQVYLGVILKKYF